VIKDRQGTGVWMVLNRSPSGSSFSSDDESRLGALDSLGGSGGGGGGGGGWRSGKERVFDVLWGGIGMGERGWKGVVGWKGKVKGKGKRGGESGGG
jgi:hypothetical protein